MPRLVVGSHAKSRSTGTIHAEGPQMWGLSRRSWYVNFSLRVPRHVAAQLGVLGRRCWWQRQAVRSWPSLSWSRRRVN